jgi:hypothetical protein
MKILCEMSFVKYRFFLLSWAFSSASSHFLTPKNTYLVCRLLGSGAVFLVDIYQSFGGIFLPPTSGYGLLLLFTKAIGFS